MKKREIKKKLVLAKTRTAVGSKRVELMDGEKNSLQIKFLNQIECREKVFTSYAIC